MAVGLKIFLAKLTGLYTILYRETAEPDYRAHRACNGINKLRGLNTAPSFKSHLRHH